MSLFSRTASTGSRFRGAVVATAIAASLLGSVALAAPAQAATVYGYNKICYVTTSGAAYTGTTYAQTWNGSAWVNSAAQAGTSNGCRTWTVASGKYVRFYAYQIFKTGIHGTYFQSGASQYVLSAAGTTWNMGKLTVGQYWY